jgi:RecG-like helicase
VDREESAETSRRLRALAEVGDGMRLAEIDLELRGFGELLRSRPSGHLVPFGFGSSAAGFLPPVEKVFHGVALLLENEDEESPCQPPPRT